MHPAAVLISHAEMAFSDQWGYWRGTVTGDITGNAAYREQPRNFELDGVEYYFEDFVIEGSDGALRGTKDGVYDLTTGDFWNQGRVSTASGRWADFRGYLIFEKGRTTPPGVFPMEGHHTPLVLISAHPASGGDERALVCRTDAPFRRDRSPSQGTLTGDLCGTIQFQSPSKDYAIGNVGYFSEGFTVTTEKGTAIGTDEGMSDRTTGEFRLCGEVTKTPASMGDLLGHMVLAWGKSSDGRGGSGKPRRLPFVLARVRDE